MKERRSNCYGFTSTERIQQLTSLVLWFTTFQIAHSLLVPEPPPLNGLNKSLDARSIDSLSKRNLPWATAVAKGTRLLCRLENPELLNDQSSATSIDMLTTSGWTRDILGVDADVFDTLNSFFLQEGISNNPDDFHGVRWVHTESSKNSKGEDVPPTGGRFWNIYNAKAGLIIAYNNFGVAYMVRQRKIKTVPDISAWSDVTFLEWQKQARASGQDVKRLNYIIRFEIASADTTAIIEQAVGDEWLDIQWPGLTMSMNEESGRGILGTPHGLGVAYLLAGHKLHFGGKTIQSVRIWWRGELGSLFAAYKIGP